MCHQESIFDSTITQHYGQWQLSTSWKHGHSRKILCMKKRPARHLGKNKGIPANQKGSGKSYGFTLKKFVHPASRKTEKEAWAKKGVPVDWKPERAVQEKVRGIKRITMSRWIILRPDLRIDYQARTTPTNLINFRPSSKVMRRLKI